MPVVLATVIFLLMILIPFLIALKELFSPKDDTPLYIDMHHFKDPLYFGRAFKKLVKNKIAVNDSKLGTSKIKLSKIEHVEICNDRIIPAETKTEKLFYVKQDFATGNRTILKKDVYIKGESTVGKHNVLRALFGEQDVYIGKNSRIIRWLCSEKNIYIAGNSHLGRSVASINRLYLEPGCRFHQLYGRPLISVASALTQSKSPDPDIDIMIKQPYPARTPLKRRSAWKIIKKHVSINCEYGERSLEDLDLDENGEPIMDGMCLDENGEQMIWECCKARPGRESCNEDLWEVSSHQVTIKPFTSIQTNFVSRKELVIKENAVIHSAVKCYKNIIIKDNVLVHGDMFAEGDIYIGNNCTLLGHIFSQSRIFIGNQVRVSSPKSVRSVIGKKKIQIGKNAIIYGYILSEGEGIVKW